MTIRRVRSELEILADKPIEELRRMLSHLPSRFVMANKINDPTRKAKLVAKLKGEWTMLDKVLANKEARQKAS